VLAGGERAGGPKQRSDLVPRRGLDVLERRHYCGCKNMGAAILFPKFLRNAIRPSHKKKKWLPNASSLVYPGL